MTKKIKDAIAEELQEAYIRLYDVDMTNYVEKNNNKEFTRCVHSALENTKKALEMIKEVK